MKRFGVIIISALLFAGCSGGKKYRVSIENPSDFERSNQPVTIAAEKLFDKGIEIPDNKIPVLESQETGKFFPQTDDLDMDGNWDEIFFVLDMAADTMVNLELSFVSPSQYKEVESRTNARIASIDNEDEYTSLTSAKRVSPEEGQAGGRFQMEGPAWENDKVGFRNYFDFRNGIDIFGKTTNKMVMDNVGIDEDYHALQDWGMDILKVGSSLGAGAIALEMMDTIVRIGPTGTGTANIVADGPYRSIIRFDFNNVEVKDEQLNITHFVNIYPGKWYFESDVWIEDTNIDHSLVTGITTMDLDTLDASMIFHNNGMVSVATHGDQTIEKEKLGMAITVSQEQYIFHTHSDNENADIDHTYMVKLRPQYGKHYNYRFYAGWELSNPEFASEDNFLNMIRKDGMNYGTPVRVMIHR